ncbi:hypothetical protein EIP91_010421 [Steccherinum ochraceum]|uniref:Uncharacterized protein n=1 Tax=Steccherinum ochraceum TaxID=92696 RepID=A0A4V2MUY2_9APHY|nr:hypothetical protein EIP91_010421 [Steccherinum ochraceum]
MVRKIERFTGSSTLRLTTPMDYFNDSMLKAAGIVDGRIRLHQEGETNGQPSQRATPRSVATSIGIPILEPIPSLHLTAQRGCSVSNAFHAQFIFENYKPDVVLISSNNVLFYAHTYLLLQSSDNSFNHLLGVEGIGNARGVFIGSLWVVGVPTDSALFNVVIHTIYGMPCNHFDPPLEILLQAVKSLKTYGISPGVAVGRDMPLYNHIVAKMPRGAIEVFLVAAENDLDALAVTASAHLLSLSLPSITEEMAGRMGPLYLNRLVALQMDRMGYLKQLLAEVPEPHDDTAYCGPAERGQLSRAWALVASGLMWDTRSGKVAPYLALQVELTV